jgi:cell division transport system permease protein
MAEKLRSLASVESVETYQRWTERIAKLLRGGVSASLVLTSVVLAAVASVIASTMRFVMQRRRVEIEVLKLIGASDRFVRRPFLVEGAVQGSVGAASSLVLLGVLYLIVRGKFDEELGLVFGVRPMFLPWELLFSVIAAGALLGAVSAWAGVRRLSFE